MPNLDNNELALVLAFMQGTEEVVGDLINKTASQEAEIQKLQKENEAISNKAKTLEKKASDVPAVKQLDSVKVSSTIDKLVSCKLFKKAGMDRVKEEIAKDPSVLLNILEKIAAEHEAKLPNLGSAYQPKKPSSNASENAADTWTNQFFANLSKIQ